MKRTCKGSKEYHCARSPLVTSSEALRERSRRARRERRAAAVRGAGGRGGEGSPSAVVGARRCEIFRGDL